MVPIHDTDLAQERWIKSQWDHYELWEKAQVRVKKRNHIWIGCTMLISFLVCSIPVFQKNADKWTSLAIARELAHTLTEMQKDAILNKTKLKLTFNPTYWSPLAYRIEKVAECKDAQGVFLKAGVLNEHPSLIQQLFRKSNIIHDFVILNTPQGEGFGVPGLATSYCFDPFGTSDQNQSELIGFAIAVNLRQLVTNNPDLEPAEFVAYKLSTVLIKSNTGEISFD